MKKLVTAIALLLWASQAWAQQSTQAGGTGCSTPATAARLGVMSPTIGTVCTITDGASATDCTTGGGTDKVTCFYCGAAWQSSSCGGASGGTDVALDLGDTGSNDSAAINEIATSGDTNNIFTEPAADKLLIDASQNWPACDAATAADDLSASCNQCVDISANTNLSVGAGLSLLSSSIGVVSNASGFLNDGGTTSLSCSAGTDGRIQVMDDGSLEYCDGAATSVLQSYDPGTTLTAGTGLTGDFVIDTSSTINCDDALADGSTKGCSTFVAADFSATSGVISIQDKFVLTNGDDMSGQLRIDVSGSVPLVLTDTDNVASGQPMTLVASAQSTPQSGDGGFISLRTENASNTVADACRIGWEWNDATSGSEDGELVFSCEQNSTTGELFRAGFNGVTNANFTINPANKDINFIVKDVTNSDILTCDGSTAVCNFANSPTVNGSTDTTYALSSRQVTGAGALGGGGDLTADRTITCNDAAADGTTKGCSTFASADFATATAGVVSLNSSHTGSAHHDAVTLAGTPDYITLSGQQLTLTKLDITDDTNLIAASGLAKAGNILLVASQEEQFLADGDATNLTCSSPQGFGSMQVMDDGSLQWCDGAATPALQTTNNFVKTAGDTMTGDLTITDVAAGSVLTLTGLESEDTLVLASENATSPSNNDTATLAMSVENDANTQVVGGRISMQMVDVTDTSEDSQMAFQIIDDQSVNPITPLLLANSASGLPSVVINPGLLDIDFSHRASGAATSTIACDASTQICDFANSPTVAGGADSTYVAVAGDAMTGALNIDASTTLALQAYSNVGTDATYARLGCDGDGVDGAFCNMELTADNSVGTEVGVAQIRHTATDTDNGSLDGRVEVLVKSDGDYRGLQQWISNAGGTKTVIINPGKFDVDFRVYGLTSNNIFACDGATEVCSFLNPPTGLSATTMTKFQTGAPGFNGTSTQETAGSAYCVKWFVPGRIADADTMDFVLSTGTGVSEVVELGTYSADGQTQYFECTVPTSSGNGSLNCSNDNATPAAIPPGDVWMCVTTSTGNVAFVSMHASTYQGRYCTHTETVTSGELPDTLTSPSCTWTNLLPAYLGLSDE